MPAPRVCSIEGCDRPHEARGWCNLHYQRWKKTGDPMKVLLDLDPTPTERVLTSLIKTATGCLEYSGRKHTNGYGILVYRQVRYYAHRVAWEAANGPIPEGLSVLHRCDNPPCCNVDHLFLGTQADNNRDMATKGRHWCSQKTHCKHGHEFTPENTRVRSSTGQRVCRACKREQRA